MILAARVCLIAAVSVVAALPARAQEDEVTRRARDHFEAGKGYFELNRYNDAVHEFTAGYALSKKPRFLLNLGQCYLRLNQYSEARDSFQRFLRDVPEDDSDRGKATRLLDEAERGVARARDAMPEPSPRSPDALTATPSMVTSPVGVERRRPWAARHRGAVVAISISSVIVAAGVVLGVYFGTRTPCTQATIGCGTLDSR